MSDPTKETQEQAKVETTPVAPTGIEPKTLASRMGITPKRLRAIMRAGYPRVAEDRGKRWLMTPEFAKGVEADYKVKKEKAEADKKVLVAAQLAGAVVKDAAKEPAKVEPVKVTGPAVQPQTKKGGK